MKELNINTRSVTGWNFKFKKQSDIIDYLPELFSKLEASKLFFFNELRLVHCISDSNNTLIFREEKKFDKINVQELINIVLDKKPSQPNEKLFLSIYGITDIFLFKESYQNPSIVYLSISISTENNSWSNEIEIDVSSHIFFPLDFENEWSLDIYNSNKGRLKSFLTDMHADIKNFLQEEEPMHPPRYEWTYMDTDKICFPVYAYDFDLYIPKERLEEELENLPEGVIFDLEEYFQPTLPTT